MLRVVDGKVVCVEFDALPNSSHAAVHVYSAKGEKQFLDGKSKNLVDQPGGAILLEGSVRGKGPSAVWFHSTQ